MPVPSQQLYGVFAVIFNGDAIGEDIMILTGLEYAG
jgi:hypothetical protein